MTLADFTYLSLTVYGEGRGEPPEGQIAIAQVILNRAEKSGAAIWEECLRPWQFSCWNNNDPNKEILEKILNGGPIPDISFYQCLSSAAQSKYTRELAPGATSYFNPDVVTPDWAAKMTFVTKIGHHAFYK